MRDLFPVLRVLGMLMVMFALSMLLPFAVSWFADDGIWRIYPWAIGITAAAGLSLWIGLDHFRRELQPRHGVILVTLVWVVLPLCAMLPLVLGLGHVGLTISFTHAYFEAVSGLTTTGATVLTGLDALPVSINVWRTFLQWLGGMGILILAVAILPLLGVGGAQLFRAEAAGPIKDTKLTPRMTETAKGLWGVYGVFSLACALAFWAAGMSPLDALMHMFATVSLGGLSSHDASFAYFDSPLIELIALVFMLLLAGVATSAGSTGGGIKMVRMLILLKQARRYHTRQVHPRDMQPVSLGAGVVDDRMIFSVLAFMLVYGATVITLSMVLQLTDLDPVTAFSAVLASCNFALIFVARR
jgi:trk system potassium uptake protein TrkH